MITFSVYTSSLRLHGIKFARNIFKGFTWDPTDVFIFQAAPSEFIEGYCTKEVPSYAISGSVAG
jgi:hypothetical protein